MKGKILVTGATGRQGGAVVKQLLQRGWKVAALTRDASKQSSKSLEQQGVELIQGNLDESAYLAGAMSGCYGLFSVQNYWEAGFEREVEQGKRLTDIAKQSGIQHLVYSSVTGAQMQTGIAHFESKWLIEEYIRGSGLAHTIVRPVCFMDSFIDFNFYKNGRLVVALPSDCSLPVIACEDIGAFVALSFEQPETFMNTTIEIAGDSLTMPEAAEKFSTWSGKVVPFEELPLSLLESQSKEMADMFAWFARSGYLPDLKRLRSINPALLTFGEWLASHSPTRI